MVHRNDECFVLREAGRDVDLLCLGLHLTNGQEARYNHYYTRSYC